MKLTLLRANAAAGMKIAGRAVAARSTLPILSHVRLAVEDGLARIAATNLEFSFVVSVGARVETPGEVCLPAETLADLIGQLTDDEIHLELLPRQKVHMTCGRADLNLNALATDEFPKLPRVKPDGLSLNARQFADALEAVMGCAATNDARPILTGVLFKFKEGGLVFAATDGFRLGVSGLQAQLPDGWVGQQMVVPAKFIGELVQLIGDAETIQLSFADGSMQFMLPNIEATTQLGEGQYPDYQQIIPRSQTTRATLDTAALLQIAKTTGLISPTAAFIFQPGAPGTATVAAQDAEKGSSQIQADATIEGAPLEIWLNAAYLKEALTRLKALGATNTIVEMTTPQSPVVVKPAAVAAGKPGAVMHVIMPLQPPARPAASQAMPAA